MEKQKQYKYGFLNAHFTGVVLNDVAVYKNQRTAKDFMFVDVLCDKGMKIHINIPASEKTPVLSKGNIVSGSAKIWANDISSYGNKKAVELKASGMTLKVTAQKAEENFNGFLDLSFLGTMAATPAVRKNGKTGKEFLVVSVYCNGVKMKFSIPSSEWDYLLGKKGVPALAKGDNVAGLAKAWSNTVNAYNGKEAALLSASAAFVDVVSRKADRLALANFRKSGTTSSSYSHGYEDASIPSEPPELEVEDDEIPF